MVVQTREKSCYALQLIQWTTIGQVAQDIELQRDRCIVCRGQFVEEADCGQAVGVPGSGDVVRVLGVPVEQLDLHRLLHPIQVMLRPLQAVLAPVPNSVVELIP